jgi:hypothetical protein
MYQQLLVEVRAAQASYGAQSQPPCPGDRLEQLRRRVRDELGAGLPEAYIDFLKAQDGLNHNGLFIYASERAPIVGATNATIQGIVDANLGWRDVEAMRQYLVFGEGNMDLYVRHLPTGAYQIVDRVPGNLINTFGSFEELIAAALTAHR